MLLHFVCIRKGPDLCHLLLQTELGRRDSKCFGIERLPFGFNDPSRLKEKPGAKYANRKDAVKKYLGLSRKFLFFEKRVLGA